MKQMDYRGDKDLHRRHPQRMAPRRAYLDVFVRLVVLLSLMGVLFVPRPERRRAYIPAIEVFDKSPDACISAVGGSKVALLFLTRGEMHHERSWRLWFRSAAGILPTALATEGSLCNLDAAGLDWAMAACSVDGNEIIDPNDVIAHQHLFSVYVHLSADIDESALTPMWRSRMVKHRVPTAWGTHSLVEASRSLLWEAFKDPSNQRFVLISEADVPLWDPLTFYHELMAEPRSRVDAWWHPDMDVGRWSWRMALSGARIRRSDWRKSAQWFGLIRSHVQVALQDEVVFVAFEDYCRSAFDGDMGKWRICYSDEHYLATLLHMKGLEEETVPSPLGITAADWSEKNPHPHEYTAEEVTPELFTMKLRNNSNCPTVAAQHVAVQEAARRHFMAIKKLLGSKRTSVCKKTEAASVPSLPSGCSFLARKFPAPSADAVHAVFRNCSSGLMLIGDAECEIPRKKRYDPDFDADFAEAASMLDKLDELEMPDIDEELDDDLDVPHDAAAVKSEATTAKPSSSSKSEESDSIFDDLYYDNF